MKKWTMATAAVVLLGLSLALPARAQTRKTMTDPFAYCAAVGNIDTPDRRYTGPKFPRSIFGEDVTLQVPASSFKQPGQPVCAGCPHWRCMHGKVYTCTDSNHLRCDARPDTTRTPNADMIAFCREHPNSDEFSPSWIITNGVSILQTNGTHWLN